VILVDSSVWIDFDRGSNSAPTQRLVGLIRSEDNIAVTEPVLMEVLAGARDNDASTELRRLLTSFDWIPAEAEVDFEAAAHLYRMCRSAGVTPRGLNDCMIASIALRSGAEILTADRDFAAMSRIVPLEIDPASAI
jgi:predicted nucleic acid-binding protein